jgi:acetyltransferase-like isoleucine patch superfamily enzyme
VNGFPTLRLVRGSKVEIGNDVTLNSMRRFNPLAPARRLAIVTNTPEAYVKIGDRAGLSNCVISCFDRITIGPDTMLGAECMIIDSDFHGLPLLQGKPTRTAPVEIGWRVFIGARSIVLKGVRIGDGAVIGAGSVVCSDIPPGCVAAGNPARVVRSPLYKDLRK